MLPREEDRVQHRVPVWRHIRERGAEDRGLVHGVARSAGKATVVVRAERKVTDDAKFS